MAERIVVGIDGSPEARHALQWATKEAVLRDAKLDVVYAWESQVESWGSAVAPVSLPETEEAQHTFVDNEIAAVRNDDNKVNIEPVVVYGRPAQALLDRAKGADLLVVGSRGRGGFAGLLMGSVSQQIAHHAPCPVVIIPPSHD